MEIIENFCHWQESSPIDALGLPTGKICLFRWEEYKIEKEAGLKDTTSIFCPYIDSKEAENCAEFRVSEYGKISKQEN